MQINTQNGGEGENCRQQSGGRQGKGWYTLTEGVRAHTNKNRLLVHTAVSARVALSRLRRRVEACIATEW